MFTKITNMFSKNKKNNKINELNNNIQLDITNQVNNNLEKVTTQDTQNYINFNNIDFKYFENLLMEVMSDSKEIHGLLIKKMQEKKVNISNDFNHIYQNIYKSIIDSKYDESLNLIAKLEKMYKENVNAEEYERLPSINLNFIYTFKYIMLALIKDNLEFFLKYKFSTINNSDESSQTLFIDNNKEIISDIKLFDDEVKKQVIKKIKEILQKISKKLFI